MTRARQHENAGLVRAIVAVDSRLFISRSIFDIIRTRAWCRIRCRSTLSDTGPQTGEYFKLWFRQTSYHHADLNSESNGNKIRRGNIIFYYVYDVEPVMIVETYVVGSRMIPLVFCTELYSKYMAKLHPIT
jgi:hypothetical protein